MPHCWLWPWHGWFWVYVFHGDISLVTRQKRESQNGGFKKTTRQIFGQTNISQEKWIFPKFWRALFSCNHRFEIHAFYLITNYLIQDHQTERCSIMLTWWLNLQYMYRHWILTRWLDFCTDIYMNRKGKRFSPRLISKIKWI